MRYYGREIDAISLWDSYVEFPPGMDEAGPFLPLVWCPNPEHDNTRTPAFQINVRDGLVHCFAGCGISGTFHRAISIIEECDERQARKIILGHRVKISPKPHARRTPRSVATISDLNFSTYIPQAGLEYLAERGITGNDIARWGLGWDEEDRRIVIPAQDDHSVTRFLIKRAIFERQWPKYLYFPEGVSKNSLLFGAGQVDSSMIRSLGMILVEGSLDAIRVAAYGLPVCATLGTGISKLQTRLLARMRPRRIYLFFDKDVAGVRGIEIAARRLGNRYPTFVMRYPATKNDPAECSRREVERAIDRAVPLSRFIPRISTGGNLGERAISGSHG